MSIASFWHLNSQAIFLHLPDKEFASVGAKSNIPYKNWFDQFKGYLMANAHKQQIKELYMWWNGWVFSLEKTPTSKLTNDDSEGSSGMDEVVECLDNSDFDLDMQECGWQDEDLIERFNTLAIASSSGSGVPQPTGTSSFVPGPSYTPSVEQQIISNILQPIEEEIRSQNSKGKEKAVDIAEADISPINFKKAVAASKGTQRGRQTEAFVIDFFLL